MYYNVQIEVLSVVGGDCATIVYDIWILCGEYKEMDTFPNGTGTG